MNLIIVLKLGLFADPILKPTMESVFCLFALIFISFFDETEAQGKLVVTYYWPDLGLSLDLSFFLCCSTHQLLKFGIILLS